MGTPRLPAGAAAVYKWADQVSKPMKPAPGGALDGHLHSVVIPPALRGFASVAPAQQGFDVSWAGGRVTRIAPAAGEADATLLSGWVDLHVHLDKNYSVDEVGAVQGDLGAAIERMKAARAGWTPALLHA